WVGVRPRHLPRPADRGAFLKQGFRRSPPVGIHVLNPTRTEGVVVIVRALDQKLTHTFVSNDPSSPEELVEGVFKVDCPGLQGHGESYSIVGVIDPVETIHLARRPMQEKI